jgi:hypothetical protein
MKNGQSLIKIDLIKEAVFLITRITENVTIAILLLKLLSQKSETM